MTQCFAYYRTVAPMIWAFAALAVCEMLVVHLFLTLRWPVVGWTLFALSVMSVVWLVRWIRSFQSCPHLLAGDHLHLRTGSLRAIKIPLSAIESVSTHWASGDHKGKGAVNVVPLAYPNRMLRLSAPQKSRKGYFDRVALRVDHEGAFDAAMKSVGIPVV
jgi:hypothetical protein